MNRILFITDTYYPDSGATTTIVKRTAEELVKRGFRVDVCPTEISGNSFDYPASFGGVTVIPLPKTVTHSTCSAACRDNCPQNCRNAVTFLQNLIDANGYDFVFSVAVAFEVNFIAHQAVKGRNCAWFPMSYDPYAFNPHVTPQQREAYAAQEVDALRDAARIFFLNEFREDYIGSPLEEKILYFNLPCIRPIDPDRTKRAVTFDATYINCVFLGDFYLGIENTDFIFRLFEGLNPKIRLYTVGNLGDYGETVELWKKKLGNHYVCHKRVSQEEAHNVMLDCDVLVSMGHDSSNMCPSKAIDFVSSGKPILHIAKIRDCCAQKYLAPYPNKYCICQNDALTAEKKREVEAFLMSAKDRETVPFKTVKELYGDFTMEVLIQKVVKAIKEV